MATHFLNLVGADGEPLAINPAQIAVVRANQHSLTHILMANGHELVLAIEFNTVMAKITALNSPAARRKSSSRNSSTPTQVVQHAEPIVP